MYFPKTISVVYAASPGDWGNVRVVRERSDRIVAEMRRKGLDVRYLLFDDEGHSIRKWHNRLELGRATEAFLATPEWPSMRVTISGERQHRRHRVKKTIDLAARGMGPIRCIGLVLHRLEPSQRGYARSGRRHLLSTRVYSGHRRAVAPTPE